MRSYPIDSPEAAARIVALTLMADSGPGESEYEVLRTRDAAGQLGLSTHSLYAVLRHFCEDLLMGSPCSWSHACRPNEQTMAAMLDEIRDPALRQRLLALCIEVVEADGRIEQGESSVLAATAAQWQLAKLPMTPRVRQHIDAGALATAHY